MSGLGVSCLLRIGFDKPPEKTMETGEFGIRHIGQEQIRKRGIE